MKNFLGTFILTTEPAEIKEFEPILQPGSITLLKPINDFFPITTLSTGFSESNSFLEELSWAKMVVKVHIVA